MKAQEIISEIRLFLFDMDGTLYIGSRLFDFTPPLLEAIKENGARYLFLTNNSSKSVADYVKKLEGLGIKAVEEDFLTSSQATVYYLKNNSPDAVLYVCGTSSLKEELKANGFEVTEDINRVDCVVMGFDTELTFKKLEDVCKILSSRNVEYIATNPDFVCPTEFGSVPDCGSICDAVFNATGKRPFVIGKPSPLMPRLAMERTGFNTYETTIVGDRIYTDIKCGINAGINSILVMSGETTQEMLENSESKPTIALEDCGVILDFLKKRG